MPWACRLASNWASARDQAGSSVVSSMPDTSFDVGRDRPFRHLGDENRGADRHLVVKLLYVWDRHAHATVRRGRPERPELGGAVDAGAAVEAHPARLDRVGRTRWDDLPREAAGPGAVRHVPGRVHLLVLDVVEPGGGLEALHAHRYRVDVIQLQALEEPELERAAVDDDERRVLRSKLARGDLGLRDLARGLDLARPVRAYQRCVHVLRQLAPPDRDPELGRHRV